jgi:hypothetical protein
MKIRTNLIGALTGITLFSFAITLSAQYSATGGDGVTASPKVRQSLNERPLTTQTTVAAKAMPCSNCKDEFTRRIDWTAKGATKPSVLVPKHLCSACATTITVAGTGKAKYNIAKHECTFAGVKDFTCCNRRP